MCVAYCVCLYEEHGNPFNDACVCENDCFTPFKSESIQTATLDIITPDYTVSITQMLLSRMEPNSLRKSGKWS